MQIRAFATKVILPCLLAVACAAPAPRTTPALQSESEEKGWSGTSVSPDAAQIADGRRIAETECAACHAIDAKSQSPNPSATPLRNVLALNDPDYLAYRFIDALQVGHDEMPLFDFNVQSADALIAYLKSISGE